MNVQNAKDNTLKHVGTTAIYTVVSVVIFGLLYPLVTTLLSQAIFPKQAAGSMLYLNGKPIGSAIIGQLWTKPQYFHGRPSAAGKGYDPSSTGATNLGPTSKKLIDSTRATIAAVRKENPDSAGLIPMDLITTSASGIDPDISPEAAYYQAPRVAKARHLPLNRVRTLIAQHVSGRTLGFLGEPRVNVLEINLALDGETPSTTASR